MIPQLLRLHIIFCNNGRYITMDEFMEIKTYSPLINNYRYQMQKYPKQCTDIINYYITEIYDKKFKFRTVAEDGFSAAEEDLAGGDANPIEMIKDLQDLKRYIAKLPPLPPRYE